MSEKLPPLKSQWPSRQLTHDVTEQEAKEYALLAIRESEAVRLLANVVAARHTGNPDMDDLVSDICDYLEGMKK